VAAKNPSTLSRGVPLPNSSSGIAACFSFFLISASFDVVGVASFGAGFAWAKTPDAYKCSQPEGDSEGYEVECSGGVWFHPHHGFHK
jgi:hypothetical protein